MEDGDTEKYHPSRVIQDFVFVSRKSGCIRYISLQVYNKSICQADFSFAPSKLVIQMLIVDKCNKTIDMLFALLYQFYNFHQYTKIITVKCYLLYLSKLQL